MIYKLVNSKKVIGKIFEDRNIDYSGFISRVPSWIFAAMSKMNVPMAYTNETVDGTVTDYKALIPDTTKILLGVSYMGWRLPRLGRINETVTDDMPDLVHDSLKYELDNNGYIIVNFEECDAGELKFYIKKFPLELDTTTNLYFPLIPENEDLNEALTSYILMMLLQRGHKVHELSLDGVTEHKNPAMAWKVNKRIAKNSMNRLDKDGREQLSKMMRSFLQDYNNYTQGNFNYKKID